MKFNPNTREIFTNDNQLIKKMDCPYDMDWDQLSPSGDANSRNCGQCNRAIVDTATLSDHELLNRLKKTPHTCLKIDFDQNNIQITTNGLIHQR